MNTLCGTLESAIHNLFPSHLTQTLIHFAAALGPHLSALTVEITLKSFLNVYFVKPILGALVKKILVVIALSLGSNVLVMKVLVQVLVVLFVKRSGWKVTTKVQMRTLRLVACLGD